MSPKPCSSDNSSRFTNEDVVEQAPEPEVAVVSRDGSHLEAAIDGRMFYVSLDSVHGRMAARAYAYSVAGDDPATARAILSVVGREG